MINITNLLARHAIAQRSEALAAASQRTGAADPPWHVAAIASYVSIELTRLCQKEAPLNLARDKVEPLKEFNNQSRSWENPSWTRNAAPCALWVRSSP